MHNRLNILVFAEEVLAAEHPTGLHRVAIESCRCLAARHSVNLVKWNRLEGQLQFFSREDLTRLFGTNLPRGISPNPKAYKVGERFHNLIDKNRPTWLLFGGVPFYLSNGNEVMARIITQCREYGVTTAAVFYDMIPITNEQYSEWKSTQVRYLNELLRCDVIFPISQYSGSVLHGYYEQGGLCYDLYKYDLSEKISVLPLPGGRSLPSRSSQSSADSIVLLGTVEPRKQQVEVLHAWNALLRDRPELAAIKIRVLGGCHPASEEGLRAAIRENPRILHHGYAPPDLIEECFDSALFSVFASNDEGFGLPITESLARGVPCLCANFGSMLEIGSRGGCIMVDVNDRAALTSGLVQLATDTELLSALRAEISHRPRRDWNDYAHQMAEALVNSRTTSINRPKPARDHGRLEHSIVNLSSKGDAASSIRELRVAQCLGGITGFYSEAEELHGLSDEDMRVLFAADMAAFRTDAAHRAYVNRASAMGDDRCVQSRLFIEASSSQARYSLNRLIAGMKEERTAQIRISVSESLRSRIASRLGDGEDLSGRVLTIVQSTNAGWAAAERQVDRNLRMIEGFGGEIGLTLIDNSLNDDVGGLLSKYSDNPRFEHVRNHTYLGPLGNMHKASTLFRGRHVWFIGEGDRISAEELSHLLRILKDRPGLPFAILNYSLYGDGHAGGGDVSEGGLAANAANAASQLRSGFYQLRQIAGERDDLLTGFSSIIFRSDILAACVNQPRSRFGSVVLEEAVPAAAMLLRRLAVTEGYWHAKPAIAVNAAKQWCGGASERHEFVAAKLFDLARDAGVDHGSLLSWDKSPRMFFSDEPETEPALPHSLGVSSEEHSRGVAEPSPV
jgi:glycosyltransferase involved in cell wall biosynthesis